MKPRSLLTVLCVLTFATLAYAESLRPRFTLTSGLTISRLQDFPPWTRQEWMKGMAGGIGAAWPIGSQFEIEPQVMGIEKGLSLGDRFIGDVNGNIIGTFEDLLVVGSIEVPVLLRWFPPKIGRLHPVVESGPFVAFELSERYKATGDARASNHASLVRNTDYGVTMGVGLEVDAGPGRWVLEGRYEPGLADLGTAGGAEQMHSRAFVLSTGYRF